jgi:peptidoglycan hydrolase CwlO-like protein
MSEDPTKDIGQKYETNPTLETILKEMRAGFAAVQRQLDDFDVRVDRIESVVNATRSEMMTLRADFKELRGQLKEHFPPLVK